MRCVGNAKLFGPRFEITRELVHVAADFDRTRIRSQFFHIDEFFERRERDSHRIGAAVDGDHNAVETFFAQRAIASDADLASDANVVRRRLVATHFVTELQSVELLALAGAALVFLLILSYYET